MPLSSQTGRIVVLTGLSNFTSSLLKLAQMEAAKMCNRCRGRAAVGDRRAHQKSAPGGRIGIWFTSGCPSRSRARTSSTSTTRVNTSAFRASADRNGGRVPAVLNAAVSTNLQAGTGSRRLVDLAANAISVGSINMHEIAFQNKVTFPVSKVCHVSTARYLLLAVPES
jgi:hypothetical protein